MTNSEPSSGARWLRCDLHVHTPWDSDRTFRENVKHAIDAFKKEKTERLAEIADRFIAALREKSIDLVALTDHNSIDGFRYLNSLFATIAEQAKDAGLPMPVVLPGVEFSVGGERPIHFLAIFGAHTSADEIDGAIRHVFGEREPFDPATGTPRATGNSVDDFLKRFYEYCRPTSGDRRLSFVLIPAHADSARGVAEETGATQIAVATTLWDEMRGHLRQWVMTRRDWHGFQTVRAFDGLPQAFRELLALWAVARRELSWDELTEDERARVRTAQHWPLIECSDPHQYEDIGSRYTWLKMETPDVEGIRLALLDPESRLRRMAAGRPEHVYPVIRRLTIRDTDFFEEVDIPLNPSLNTLIGGRGSGKSTVLECLRYVLDRARASDFDENEHEMRENVEGFLSPKNERDFGETNGMLLPEHHVSVELQIADRLYTITRSKDAIRVTIDSSEDPAPLDVRSLLTPRILSQRQIAQIARDPAAQRREIDALRDPSFSRTFDDRQRTLVDEIERLQTRRRTIRERVDTLTARQTELRRVRDQVEFLERGGNEEVLSRFRLYQAEERWLERHAETLEAIAQRLSDAGADAEDEVTRLGEPPDGPTAEWTRDVARRTSEAIAQARETITQHAAALRELKDAATREQTTKWTTDFDRAKSQYDEVRREMEKRGVEFGQHARLVSERDDLEREVADLNTLSGDLAEVQTSIRDRRRDLIQLHEERLARRREIAKALEEQDADIRIEIVAFGDLKDLASRREEWFGGTGVQERDWEILTNYIFSDDGAVSDRLREVVDALRADIEATQVSGSSLSAEESRVGALLGDDGARLTRYFFNALERGDRIRLDDMERFLPEDRVEARVREADGHFKPIEQGSIGQRSTAVIALLLSAGEQPLIIDQPEDDLDNQYVYDVVVGLLRKRKFSRQILIATHNANIPVNGDAELILALEVRNRLGQVVTAGSIDRRDVKEAVAAIMEGSAEAFRLRRERYGY